MKEITVPAEIWDQFAKTNNCQALSQQERGNAVSVKVINHQGYLHMAHAALYATYSPVHPSTLYTYRLLPEELLEGGTTVWHDEKAIQSGRRKRGDHSGLVVSVRGERMVCAFPVHFIKGLPSPGCRISLSEAKTFDQSNRRWGWRALSYHGVEPSWMHLSGHPVVRYASEEGDLHVLLWRGKDGIEEMAIDSSLLPSAPDEGWAEEPVIDVEPQMVLF